MQHFSETVLRTLLIDAYSLADPEITLIRTGGDGNQTFKIVANPIPFLARIYGEQARHNPEWAQYELELLAHLAEAGISVAAPIASHSGTAISTLREPATSLNFSTSATPVSVCASTISTVFSGPCAMIPPHVTLP